VERLANCSGGGGQIDICTFCEMFHCDANIHLPSSWIEEEPIFSAVRFNIHNKKTVVVTVPGEALIELGWKIRNTTEYELDFDETFLFGYSNSYCGYFAPFDEYLIGGYEGLLTLWGDHTADMVHDAVTKVARKISPLND